ncbi:hypothetical protein H1R20_g12151, partial [Candolleomyces eurysporus]
MSWFKEAAGGPAPPTFKEAPEKLTEDDPYIPGRKVSNKAANRPFLAYHEYRQKQEALHQEWLKKKKERDEKIARGEKVGPLERDPTAVEEVGLLGLLKFFFVVSVVAALAGKFITGSYTWDYEARWLELKRWMPQDNGRLFSPEYLATFNGENPDKPIYIAIDGEVYDVTKGASYQKGGSYHILAGKEGARAFGTGCFMEHMTHDKRGLDKEERDSIEHWKKFYLEHKNYRKVGRVALPPIDTKTDPPLHCDPKKRAAELEARKAKAARAEANAPKPTPTPDADGHQEL